MKGVNDNDQTKDKFQSLFYWMYVKNNGAKAPGTKDFKVSILVLLDVCKERLI